MSPFLSVLPSIIAAITATIIEAVTKGDVETLDKLSKICPTPEMIELRARAERERQEKKAKELLDR